MSLASCTLFLIKFMFKLTKIPLEKIQLKKGLDSPQAGAFACFEGRVRDQNNGKSVTHLIYEANEALCNKEAQKILDEVREQYPLMNLRVYHRVGELKVGELAVWIGVSAVHRDEALKACRFIIEEIKRRLPIWKKEFTTDGESQWVGCQHQDQVPSTKDQGDSGPCSLALGPNVSEQDYYNRQMSLPEIGSEGQKLLKDARVLVVGAGGLGCPALMSLAGAGIGQLGICEHDKIELSNLHRQFLYTFDDVGAPKAQVAATKISVMNPTVSVTTHDVKLAVDNIESLLDDYDVILDCTDTIETKYLLNDACYLRHKTLIQAGIYQWEGQLRVMTPSQKGCLRCVWPNIPDPGVVGTCVDGGVLGVIPNIFGHLQAMEALRFILNMEKVFENELLIFNVADFNIRRLKIKPEVACPLCGEDALITNISREHYEPKADFIVDCAHLNSDQIKEYRLVDVREEQELKDDPLSEIPSEHYPLSAFMEDQIPFDKEVKHLLFCEKGIRSSRLAAMIRELGYDNIFSAKDGIESIRAKLNTTVTE